MKTILSSKTFWVGCVLLCIGAGAYWFNLSTSNHVSYSEVSFVADFTDKQRLAGAVDNIFIGTVVAQSGTHMPSSIPETLFTVTVEQNLKGDLTGTVTVNQQGGYWPENDDPATNLHLVEGDALLIPGKTYLFATRADDKGQWHTLVPNYGDLVIENEKQKAELITEFEEAVAHQILFNPSE